ncbi:hypothetical protein AXK57_19815 [Tsukamurella pulmonis]|uniref:hypothetical protein n=1 Tax=Tsukamurella pulmonis TaxID=47312 RepID=UPI00079A770B|nr:hypothetical protein [Tsukamurella pulmonis]KXP12199.1 hypothetical protein AXK57_19815 [Tsukamurella pulmonis]
MSAQDRLAATLAKHRAQYDDYFFICDCGEKWPALAECLDEEVAAHERHLAAVIASSDDLAVVELPKLEPLGSFGARAWNATFTEDDRRCMDGYDSYAHVEVDSDGLVELDTSAEDGLFADEAEQVAAALLAAAKAAEAVTSDGE